MRMTHHFFSEMDGELYGLQGPALTISVQSGGVEPNDVYKYMIS